MIRIQLTFNDLIVETIPKIAVETVSEPVCEFPPLVLPEGTPDALRAPICQVSALLFPNGITDAFSNTVSVGVARSVVTPPVWFALFPLAALCLLVIFFAFCSSTQATNATQPCSKPLEEVLINSSLKNTPKRSRRSRKNRKQRSKRRHNIRGVTANSPALLPDGAILLKLIECFQFIQRLLSPFIWFVSFFSSSYADSFRIQLALLKDLLYLASQLTLGECKAVARKNKKAKSNPPSCYLESKKGYGEIRRATPTARPARDLGSTLMPPHLAYYSPPLPACYAERPPWAVEFRGYRGPRLVVPESDETADEIVAKWLPYIRPTPADYSLRSSSSLSGTSEADTPQTSVATDRSTSLTPPGLLLATNNLVSKWFAAKTSTPDSTAASEPAIPLPSPEASSPETFEKILMVPDEGECTLPTHATNAVETTHSSNTEEEASITSVCSTTPAPFPESILTDALTVPTQSIMVDGVEAVPNGLSDFFGRLVHTIEPLRASKADSAELEASVKSVVDSALGRVSSRSTSAGATGKASSRDGTNSIGSDGATIVPGQTGVTNTGDAASTKASRICALLENSERTIVVNTCLIQAGAPEDLNIASKVEDESFAFAFAIQKTDLKRIATLSERELTENRYSPTMYSQAAFERESVENQADTKGFSREISNPKLAGETISIALRPFPRSSSNQKSVNPTKPADHRQKENLDPQSAAQKSCLKMASRLRSIPQQKLAKKVSFANYIEVKVFEENSLVSPPPPINAMPIENPSIVTFLFKAFCNKCRRKFRRDSKDSVEPAKTPEKKTPEKTPEKFEMGPTPRRNSPPLKLRSSMPTGLEGIEIGPSPRRASPLKLSSLPSDCPQNEIKPVTTEKTIWRRFRRHCCPCCRIKPKCAPLTELAVPSYCTPPTRRYITRRNTCRDWISRHSKCWCD